MLSKRNEIESVEYFPGNFHNISIHIRSVISEHGKVLIQNQANTCAFVCTELDNMIKWLAENLGVSIEEAAREPVVSMMRAVWTKDLIHKYNDFQSKSHI